MNAQRSGCPINLTVASLGDRGSLIVIRDPMLGNRRHTREVLTRSAEGIASNRLADRLKQERRHLHLEAPAPKGAVLSRPQSAHDAAIGTPPV